MSSIWLREFPHHPPLRGDTKTEIAVIGAGMAGLLIADRLHRAGHRVMVLEADRIAGGQTSRTTAKITSQHGLIYQKLIRALGREKAAAYARSNENAIAAYENMIRDRGIDCDFVRCAHSVYGADTAALRSEKEAAVSLGLPASYTDAVPLPVPAAGAVRFDGQARFHPTKFLRAVSDGLIIHEQTTVERVEGQLLHTNRGRVEAQEIVFATHYPFVNFPGLYFIRMHQERSYVLALREAELPEDMWIGAEKGGYSFRRQGDLLLLGGGGHRTGENRGGGRYDDLRQKARLWYPHSTEAAHWSAQDCMTPDGAPYIGRYAACRPHWYVATGFGKWGMTSAMVSALLIGDLIEGRSNPAASVFDPGRFNVSTAAGVAAESGAAAVHLGKRLLYRPAKTADSLRPGQGGVVTVDGKKAGAYRHEDGTLYTVDLRCPHLGCELEWNGDERTWDCPCHGSRFDYTGALLSGPAQEDLRRP